MACIGIFDSGSGGLSVLKEILRLIPGERFIYYSDNAHCPYGEKSQEYIIDRSRAITGYLLDEGAQIIVIACNTATGAAIGTLRKDWPEIPFIGMEPAVKPAAALTGSGVVGVLATKSTLTADKYKRTKARFSEGVKVVEHVGEGFVELVESLQLEGEEVENTVKASLQPLLEAGADTVVLGCTHYPFLLPVMQKIAGEGVRFIDPAPAVARRVLHIIKENGIELENRPEVSVKIKSSGSDETARRLLNYILLLLNLA